MKRRWYHAGAFLNAALDKSSLENERNALHIARADGVDVVCVQIAGLIARRILCYVGPGDRLEQQGVVGNRRCHGAGVVDEDLDRHDAGVGHERVRRLEPDDIVECRRYAAGAGSPSGRTVAATRNGRRDDVACSPDERLPRHHRLREDTGFRPEYDVERAAVEHREQPGHLAGHLGLGKLLFLYDANEVTLDPMPMAFIAEWNAASACASVATCCCS